MLLSRHADLDPFSFLPLLYIFTALPLLRHRAAGKNDGINLIPGGSLGCWLVSALGFATTLLAIVTSIVPPDTSADRGLFLIKVGGGCVLIIGIGLAFYARGRYRRSSAAS